MARIAVLTASDKGSSGTREDSSGAAVRDMSEAAGHTVTASAILPDEREAIAKKLATWCDQGLADVVLTTGGTGLGARDVTPEATRGIGERDVPGIPAALMSAGLAHTPFAALSRGIAVTRGTTLIVNLPGSTRAVREGMEVLLPLLDHISDLLTGSLEHEGPGVARQPRSER